MLQAGGTADDKNKAAAWDEPCEVTGQSRVISKQDPYVSGDVVIGAGEAVGSDAVPVLPNCACQSLRNLDEEGSSNALEKSGLAQHAA